VCIHHINADAEDTDSGELHNRRDS
jgi:hypothetical protein